MSNSFSGDPVTRWYSGDQGFRKMELVESFSFTDHVREWAVEKGCVIDGASIPRALWTTVGAPYVGRYRRASIVHDIFCQRANSDDDRRAADKMFYRACRADGLSRVESAILYCGVRFGAWWSGGHLLAESDGPLLTDDASDKRIRSLFTEVAQRVIRDADRLSEYGEDEEADILEQAFEVSLDRTVQTLMMSSPDAVEIPALSEGSTLSSFTDEDELPIKPATAHKTLPIAGDLEFDSRLIDSPCGVEDRIAVEDTTQFPHSAICFLELNGRFRSARGTGFFIAPDTIVTAGHCLHGRLGFIRSVRVIPGRDEEDWPFDTAVAKSFHVPREWSRSRLPEFDYGVIKLGDHSLGDRVGAFEIDSLDDDFLRGALLTTAGYPADLKRSKRQHVNSGPCQSVEPQRLGYNLDTWKGASGSPVWTIRDDKPVVIGIHNYGHCPNRATRINERVLGDLRRWMASPAA